MSCLHFHISFQRLDLKYTWAISRNATDFKTNAFVTVTDGTYTGIGEAAPNIRYGESPEHFEKVFSTLGLQGFKNLSGLTYLLKEQRVPNALRFGIESAYVHYVCAKEQKKVWEYLGLKNPAHRDTSYTIPIMPPEKLADYFAQYCPQRFKYIKLKVNKENLVEFVQEVSNLCTNPLMIDANEAYDNPDQLLDDLKNTDGKNIEFVEQPFPASFVSEYKYLKTRTTYPLFADESITDEADFDSLLPCFHGINVKLMKAGGYLNGIRLLREAKSHGLKTMLGCMVETGLGISSGYQLASLADYLDLDSFLILKKDPFPMMEENDGLLFLKDEHKPA